MNPEKDKDNDNDKKIIDKSIDKLEIEDLTLLVNDELVSQLKPKIKVLAKLILIAKKLNRFVLLRFHNDADGISAALAITSILSCHTIQQNSAVYTTRDAINDLNIIQYQNSPMIIFVDFGLSEESIEGLKLLKSNNVEILIIDHHPPSKGAINLANFILSPWQVSENDECSKYPAGYLACELARFAGVKNIDYLASISCAGDKSNILKIEEKDREKAIVLDHLAINPDYKNNLDFYRRVLNDKDTFESLLQQTRDKMAQITEDLKKIMKKHVFVELSVYVFDIDKIAKKYEFPSRGKIATQAFELLGNKQPNIIIGYGNRTVILRINDLAVNLGHNADKLIQELKNSVETLIESGGGHAKAAAIRTKPGFAKTVCNELIKIIEKKSMLAK